MKIYDISQELLGCRVYPGDPTPKIEMISSIESGDLYNLTSFSMCAHNGTHIDAPRHFLAEGKSVDAMALSHFVGSAYVAECRGALTADDAAKILKKAAEKDPDTAKRILIKGDAVVTADAARIFAEAKILLLGVESQTVGPEAAPMEVHKLLLESEAALLEGIRLTDVTEGAYFLSAAPLNIAGADGSPCRAILIDGV